MSLATPTNNPLKRLGFRGFFLVSLDVEKIPRFYRGKKEERSDKKCGELDASRKTFKKEEPHVK